MKKISKMTIDKLVLIFSVILAVVAILNLAIQFIIAKRSSQWRNENVQVEPDSQDNQFTVIDQEDDLASAEAVAVESSFAQLGNQQASTTHGFRGGMNVSINKEDIKKPSVHNNKNPFIPEGPAFGMVSMSSNWKATPAVKSGFNKDNEAEVKTAIVEEVPKVRTVNDILSEANVPFSIGVKPVAPNDVDESSAQIQDVVIDEQEVAHVEVTEDADVDFVVEPINLLEAEGITTAEEEVEDSLIATSTEVESEPIDSAVIENVTQVEASGGSRYDAEFIRRQQNIKLLSDLVSKKFTQLSVADKKLDVEASLTEASELIVESNSSGHLEEATIRDAGNGEIVGLTEKPAEKAKAKPFIKPSSYHFAK